MLACITQAKRHCRSQEGNASAREATCAMRNPLLNGMNKEQMLEHPQEFFQSMTFVKKEKKQKETMPVGVTVMRSPVLYRAAQVSSRSHGEATGGDRL